MRALERGEIGPTDAALLQHLDACLGCVGCEPVCPSGVGYGRGIQTAREQLFGTRRLPPLATAVLAVFRRDWLWRPAFTLARWLRATGLPASFASGGRAGFGMGMLAASAPAPSPKPNAGAPALARSALAGSAGGAATRVPPSVHTHGAPRPGAAPTSAAPADTAVGAPATASAAPTVALFRGCVMDTLFAHVHDATRRTLEVNGYRVVEVERQVCCGALHEHAGDRAAAEALARQNVEALTGSADWIVVNSAGCGALLKAYGHLLDTDAAAALAAKVRDVSELLAERGPHPGGELSLEVAYDAPCHLQHAQRVHAAPLAVLEAIPGVRLRILPSSDKCCGSAGIYSVLRPAMARAVLDLKIESFAAATPHPDVVATGNPGCLMQIGAGLRAAGLPIRVMHPVEILDESYRRGGLYREPAAAGGSGSGGNG